MSGTNYTEDTLVQQTTADYLEHQLGWQSVYAYHHEDFGPESLLGRASDREVVLTRTLHEKLEEFETDDINVAQRLEKELKRDYHIITADKRLDQVARDFVQQDRDQADISEIIRQLHQVVNEAIEIQPGNQDHPSST